MSTNKLGHDNLYKVVCVREHNAGTFAAHTATATSTGIVSLFALQSQGRDLIRVIKPAAFAVALLLPVY